MGWKSPCSTLTMPTLRHPEEGSPWSPHVTSDFQIPPLTHFHLRSPAPRAPCRCRRSSRNTRLRTALGCSFFSLSLSLVKNLEPFAEALLLGLLFYLRSLLLSITKQLHQRPLCALSTLKSLSVSKEAAAWCAQHLSWPELVL